MRIRVFLLVCMSLLGAPAQGGPQPERDARAPAPRASEPAQAEAPASVGLWLDAVGFATGFLMGGVDYALSPRLTLGLVLTRADVDVRTEGLDVRAEGVGWGMRSEYFFSRSGFAEGLVAGGTLLFLPTSFTDRSTVPEVQGEVFALGAILSVGYQFNFGPFSVRPSASLVYLDLPSAVAVEDGGSTDVIDIDKVRGTVAAGHLQFGVVF